MSGSWTKASSMAMTESLLRRSTPIAATHVERNEPSTPDTCRGGGMRVWGVEPHKTAACREVGSQNHSLMQEHAPMAATQVERKEPSTPDTCKGVHRRRNAVGRGGRERREGGRGLGGVRGTPPSEDTQVERKEVSRQTPASCAVGRKPGGVDPQWMKLSSDPIALAVPHHSLLNARMDLHTSIPPPPSPPPPAPPRHLTSIAATNMRVSRNGIFSGNFSRCTAT
jgi:hypothetical protein